MNKNAGLLPLATAPVLSVPVFSVPMLLVPILFGSLFMIGCDNKGASAPPTPPARSVSVVTLQAQDVTITSDLPGRVNAFRVAEVRPQVNGIILKRNFVEGSEVRAGESLYQIDPATYQAAFDTAKGNLSKAKASAEITSLTVKRYQPLLKTKYVSQQDYDTAVANERQALAAVESANAALESARINLEYTRVTSPISGRTGKSSVTEGALVATGQISPLAVVQQLDPVYVDLTQSSTDLLRLKRELAAGVLQQEGGRATVTMQLDDGSTYAQTGTLEFSEVTVDETTGTVTLRAIFPNPDKTLLPGMFVKAVLNEGLRKNTILAPQRGISRTPRGEASAMIVNNEGKTEQRIIKVDQAIGDKWLVTEGLQAGDKVIVSGLVRLAPGIPVNAQEYQDEAKTAAQASGPINHNAATRQ